MGRIAPPQLKVNWILMVGCGWLYDGRMAPTACSRQLTDSFIHSRAAVAHRDLSKCGNCANCAPMAQSRGLYYIVAIVFVQI